MSSKMRMALAGLTAVALFAGVMAADPADAGKKKKKRAKAKSSKVVQVSKGGNAKAGNGGAGGAGGRSGNVNNTGNVVGGPFGPGPFPFPGPADCVLTAFRLAGDPGAVDALDALEELEAFLAGAVTCGAGPALIACLEAEAADPDPILLNQGEVIDCLGGPFGPFGPGPFRSGVFSGDGGAGGGGGTGGDAFGGSAGNNTNSSTVTVNRDDHSIDAG